MFTEWKKGQFLIYPKAMQWGVGIVTEDQSGEQLKVFFETKLYKT